MSRVLTSKIIAQQIVTLSDWNRVVFIFVNFCGFYFSSFVDVVIVVALILSFQFFLQLESIQKQVLYKVI